jgi:hypothetical protein
MNLRKIAVVGSFAAGAALALAPLASADPAATDPVTPGLITFEENLLNSQFASDVALAGDSKDLVPAGASNPFDTVLPADAPDAPELATGTTTPDLDGDATSDATTPTFLDYELYGVNPMAAGPADDPGSYNLFNGAEIRFDEAYNAELVALSGGTLTSTDVLGASIPAGDTAAEAATHFLNLGLADLEGFFGIFPSM